MHWSYRANAVSFALLAIAGAVLASGYWPSDPGWAIAGFGGCVMYAMVSVLLWRGVAWAHPVGVGLAGFATGVWIQSTLALTVFSCDGTTSDASVMTCTAGVTASLVAFGLLWTIPREFGWRHGIAIAFAGAAVVPGVLFALAPAQSLGVAIAMGLGCCALVAGTVAIGRGRTWGLLVNVLGAAIIGTGVYFAPWLGKIQGANPWIPDATGFLVDVLGMATAGLALLSTAMYAGPVLRFLGDRD